jgi:hypothetical protein
VPSLEVSYLESRPGGCTSGGVAGSVLGSCCRGDAEGPWVPYDLSHRARFCGELGEGWAEELLSLRPQMFESLSEE